MSQRKAFLLRVTPELYATLERWAAEELRSVNGQIEYLLTQAARRSGRGGVALAPPGAGEASRPGEPPAPPPGGDAAPDATGIP